MTFFQSRHLSTLLIVVLCSVSVNCAHRAIDRQAYHSLNATNRAVEIHLKNGTVLAGTILTITEAYAMISVSEVPDATKPSHTIPIAIGTSPITLYRINGENISGQIISVREEEVEIIPVNLQGALPSSDKIIVQNNEIEDLFPMGGRPGEARITILHADVQSIHSLEGRKSGKKSDFPTVGVSLVVGALLGYLFGL